MTVTDEPPAVRRAPATPAVLSVGYEGRTLGDLVGLLVDHGTTLLLDVRLNAISRKPGLSKSALRAGLAGAGIGYRHARALGNPQDNREPFRSGDTARGVAVFRGLLAHGRADAAVLRARPRPVPPTSGGGPADARARRAAGRPPGLTRATRPPPAGRSARHGVPRVRRSAAWARRRLEDR